MTRPLIAIPACRKMLGHHPFHVVGEKYLTAVADLAGGLPLALPALGARLDLADLLARIDGILLTGSHSNVEPHHYGGPPSAPGTLHDPERDATTLPLIRAAVQAGVPVMAICRGFQEMNVAFGGTLHQRVHELEGMMDHREDPDDPLEVQYGPAHEVRLTPGGWLAGLLGRERIIVNSVHWQGVERLGPGLAAEATAPDGLVEAFRVAAAPAFTLAVQWHPEWKAAENPVSVALFRAFGDACRARAAARSQTKAGSL
ncbi:MAG TPA: gamma-glutamyl-gamma-aminobutyrate hydrolase family protein [Candidatus Competibacteraceae bacterium]|nr:gamma-glutamyl-gamma-aminobutyrate hydrolase family protein [Candidatus Competibacteraceae bacterium]